MSDIVCINIDCCIHYCQIWGNSAYPGQPVVAGRQTYLRLNNNETPVNVSFFITILLRKQYIQTAVFGGGLSKKQYQHREDY